MDNTENLIHVLQMAISPAVLISGVGLLVLSMTNRFAHTTDRARSLAAARSSGDSELRLRIASQIRLLYRRSQILLQAISLALTSVLFAALMVIALFVHYWTGIPLQYFVLLSFVLSLTSLIGSLILFLRDMSLSLDALREEVSKHLEASDTGP